MKHIYFACCLLTAIFPLSQSVFAQCGIEVNAGEDFILCDPLTPASLNGSIDGPYANFFWSPSALLSAPSSLQSPVNVTQTTTFILRARTDSVLENLVFNPDFEMGNVGFYSDLDYSPGSLLHPDSYDVLTNPQAANDSYYNCVDHTTGAGYMLAATNTYNFATVILWRQTVPVTPNTDYYFSYWAQRIAPGALGGVTFSINNSSVSGIGFNANTPKCEWTNRNGIWNSGNNTSAMLTIRSWKFAQAVALDDIFFGPFCETTDSVTVFVESVKAAAPPLLYELPCEGFELTLSGAGSSVGPNYAYQWETQDGNIVSGHNTLNPVVNAPGTYTLTVSLINGIGDCIKTASTEVAVLNALQAGISAPLTLNCYSPYVVMQGFSSQPGATSYQWTASQGGSFASGTNNSTALANQPGEYTLLVTNIATGCTAESTISISAPVLPVATATAAPITCALSQTTLSGTGSSTGNNFSYAWTTVDGNILSGQNNQNAVANAPGTYVLSVTNTANNCATTDTAVVPANNTPLSVSILPASSLTCTQSNVTLSTDSATAGTHRIYSWTALPGGNIASGANTLNPVVNAPGLYVLLVTDTLNTCTGTDTVSVVADNDAIIAIANANGELDCITATLTLDAQGSSNLPQLTYSWSTADGHIVSGAGSPNPVVDEPGTYHLLLTNPANGCTATDVAEVAQNIAAPELDILPYTPLSCAQPLLTLMAQNTAPAGDYTYDWTASDGGHIFSGDSTLMLCVDAAGTYSLLATNLANGCTAVTTAQVTEDFVAPDVALSVSGALNCHVASVKILNSSIADPALLDHQWTLPDGSGVNTGAIPSLEAAQPGAYNLLLSNIQNGCTSTASIVVSEQSIVSTALSGQEDATCFGSVDGVLAITASGGSGTYTYLWSNGQTTATATGLAAGIYTVTVTDADDCTATFTAGIAEPAELLAGATATPLSSAGASDGTASSSPQGGTAPYLYLWSTGETTSSITGLPAGFYTVTTTDANGCTAAQTVEVTGSDCAILAQIQTAAPVCEGASDGSATALPQGGTAPYAYVWSSGSTEQTASNLSAGVYSVTVTDANDCSATATVTLQSVDPEPPLIDAASVTIPLGPSGAIELTLQILDATVTDNCEVESVQIVPDAFDCFDLGPQEVTITAHDASGNMSSQTITVTFVDIEIPVLQCPPGVTRCAGNNIVEYAAPVAIDNCLILGGTFVLVTGLPSGAPFPQGSTQNTYTYTDVSGNTGTCSFEVTILSPLTITVDSVIHDVNSQSTGGIQVSVGGSLPGYSYEWIRIGEIVATTEDLSGVGTGVYTLVVTDAAGCKTETGSIEVSNLVDTDNPDWSDLIAIYPNPSSGRVFVVLPDKTLAASADFEVYDAQGRRVLEQRSESAKRVELDLSDLAGGLYTIIIRLDDGVAAKKIVINR